MAARLYWTPKARSDIKQIYLEIAKFQPAAAERHIQRLREKIERLRDYPQLGQSRPDVFPSARMLVEAPYLVLYELPEPDQNSMFVRVEIVRILDGRRDLSRIFETG